MNIRYPLYEGVYRILTLYISFADILKGFTVAVWVGSSGPALCSLGGGEKACAGCCFRHTLSVWGYAAFPLSGFSVFGAVTFFSATSAACCRSASLAAFFSAFFISFILSSKRSCRF